MPLPGAEPFITWCFQFNGTSYGSSDITADQGDNWAITNIEVGGELVSVTCNNAAAFANDRLMSVALIDTNWVQYSPYTSTLQIDSPCGFEGSAKGAVMSRDIVNG